MANILLTDRCVRRCPYCFAGQKMYAAPAETLLEWEDLVYAIDFLIKGGETSVSLLGGEPTRHPDFLDMALYCVARGLRVWVFTSGVCPEELTDRLSRLDIDLDRLGFVVNYNDPRKTPASEKAAVERFFEATRGRTCLGINVYHGGFDYAYPVNAINSFGLARSIRVGIAHPLPGGGNLSVPPEMIREVAGEFIEALPYLAANGVTVSMDCGFPLCAFSDADLGLLYRHTLGRMNFSCEPGLDIGPDLTVWSCFPTEKYTSRSLYDFDSLQQIREEFDAFWRAVRVEHGGMYLECDSCRDRLSGLCDGGCLSHSLSKFLCEPKIRLQNVYPR